MNVCLAWILFNLDYFPPWNSDCGLFFLLFFSLMQEIKQTGKFSRCLLMIWLRLCVCWIIATTVTDNWVIILIICMIKIFVSKLNYKTTFNSSCSSIFVSFTKIVKFLLISWLLRIHIFMVLRCKSKTWVSLPFFVSTRLNILLLVELYFYFYNYSVLAHGRGNLSLENAYRILLRISFYIIVY